MEHHIPRCMSTQHPDNANAPFFAEESEIGGEDEIKEAEYAFAQLGCDEQMWDCEGKEVDNYVVKKLLTKYEQFFRQQVLGRQKFLTLRVPNPGVEKAEAKILLETLESIPRSYDAARLFYQEDIPPIFEVILPMTGSASELNRIYYYYKDFVAGKGETQFHHEKLRISDWIGEFNPSTINVIPLFESNEHMLSAHLTLKEYLRDKQLPYQRVFLARSDPAMNYGMIAAVLFNKIALYNISKLSHEIKIPLYPIIGVGSVPFRGNLTPKHATRVAEEYPSVQTFTIQSSFKYDHPTSDVIEGIRQLNSITPSKPQEISADEYLGMLDRYSTVFRKQIMELAPPINRLAGAVPSRRKRKLHIGLFGYSREMQGTKLPRAIPFTTALYSLGLPPELLGLDTLSNDDLGKIKKCYIYLEEDLKDALRYYNSESPFVPENLKKRIVSLPFSADVDHEHKAITTSICKALSTNHVDLKELILKAAKARMFLG